jgi:hypothetical protein
MLVGATRVFRVHGVFGQVMTVVRDRGIARGHGFGTVI